MASQKSSLQIVDFLMCGIQTLVVAVFKRVDLCVVYTGCHGESEINQKMLRKYTMLQEYHWCILKNYTTRGPVLHPAASEFVSSSNTHVSFSVKPCHSYPLSVLVTSLVLVPGPTVLKGQFK